MSNLGRLLKEQAGQTLSVLVTLVDRIVLTGVLYRAWGHAEFERWSTCMALAGFVTMFEFGFNLYFNNRLTTETEQHKLESMERVYFIGNMIFAVLSVLGFAVITLLAIIAPNLTGSSIGPQGVLVVACLAAAAALRLAACGASSLYRANRQYTRLTMIVSVSEAARIAAVLVVVALKGGIVAAAVVSLIVAASMQWAYVLYDTRRRFWPHSIGFVLPRWRESKETIAISSGYFLQNVPLVALANLPVLVLVSQIEAVGQLAIFVLMRTLTGFPRAILQALGVVAGQECGRQVLSGDRAAAIQTLQHSGRAFSALSGIATGLLLGAGAEIGALWTGATDTTRFSYLLAGAAPMIVAPISVLAHNVAASTNEPYFAALGRWAQFILTFVFLWLAPIDDPGLRMLAALAIGEIFGFSPLIYYGITRTISGAGIGFHVRAVARAIFAALVTTAMTVGIMWQIQPQGTVGRLFTLMLAGVSGIAIFPWVGLDGAGRSMLMSRIEKCALRLMFVPRKKRAGE